MGMWGKTSLTVLSRWLAIGGVLFVTSMVPALAQTVFRVTDEHGNVTFTDNPGRGGEAMELAPLPSLPPAPQAAPGRQELSRQLSPQAASSANGRPRGRPGQPFMPYDHFIISMPQQGAQLEEGMTAVEVTISPDLREDHQVRLLVNGEISQTALHSNVFWLAGLAAGRYELQAELLDSSQRVQHRTGPVAITVP